MGYVSSTFYSGFCSLPYFFPQNSSSQLQKQTPTPKNVIVSRDVPSLWSPFAPSTAVTNNKVALAVLPPPSPVSPASDRHASVSYLFCNAQEKHLSNLPSTGYFPAKKKGWHLTQLAGISPHDTGAFDNVDCSSDNSEDDYYFPTPIYNVIRATQPKTRDQKVTLDINYFTYLCPLTFDSKRFHQGHPPVYTHNDIQQLDANYQKQLSFNFCATCASKKKFTLICEACASCLCNIGLTLYRQPFHMTLPIGTSCPITFLEDVLTCPIGGCLIVCIHAGARESYQMLVFGSG